MSAVLQIEDYAEPAPQRTLSDLRKGESARILSIESAAPQVGPDLTRRLTELGFLPGEYVRVLAHGPVGAEPIAVRVGASTFALRRLEADCIRIAALV